MTERPEEIYTPHSTAKDSPNATAEHFTTGPQSEFSLVLEEPCKFTEKQTLLEGLVPNETERSDRKPHRIVYESAVLRFIINILSLGKTCTVEVRLLMLIWGWK